MDDLLAGFWSRTELRRELGRLRGGSGKPVSDKTITRYERAVDGLPYAEVAGAHIYPKQLSHEWVQRRIKVPNPTKAPRSRRKAQPAPTNDDDPVAREAHSKA